MVTRLMVFKLKFWMALAMGAFFGVLFPDVYDAIDEVVKQYMPVSLSPTWRGHGG